MRTVLSRPFGCQEQVSVDHTEVYGVDQEMLSTIKRNAGLGMALGIGIVVAGVLAIMSLFMEAQST